MEQRKYRYSSEYMTGSTARKLQPQWEQEEVVRSPRKRTRIVEEQEIVKRPRVGQGIDAISMLLLTAAIVTTLILCVNYLKVQSEVLQLNKSISALESKITSVKKENDAWEASLESQMLDLEYVYEIAVGTLGMVYPNHNEVIYYNNDSEGYFRQYQDIPE